MNTERSSDQAGLQNQPRQGQHLRSVPFSKRLIEALDDNIFAAKDALGFDSDMGSVMHELGYSPDGVTPRGGQAYAKLVELGEPLTMRLRATGESVQYPFVRIRAIDYFTNDFSVYKAAARAAGKMPPYEGAAYVFVKLARRDEAGKVVSNTAYRYFIIGGTPEAHDIGKLSAGTHAEVVTKLRTFLARVERRFAGKRDIDSTVRFLRVLTAMGGARRP